MARDQGMVKQLQQRLRNWNPDVPCPIHSADQCCTYDEQGQLIELHLCRLDLVQIPSEVWQCSSLQLLYLDTNQLSTLPAEMGQLSSLEVLGLGGNQLHTLPAEVGQLSSLELLFLDDNQLSVLPAEVGQLSSLLALRLRNNQLSVLPVEVGQLSSLGVLVLGSNQLSVLPAEVGQLSSLQWLYLSDNQLGTLPVEVGQLSSLGALDVDNNQLSVLPAEMGQLSSLRELCLSNNHLSMLPAEMGQLSSLQKLELDNNPLQWPPPAIVAQGTPAILSYLRTQPRPIKIFYCYAHEDKDLRDRIDKHLGVLKRLRHVVGWYDREIQAGTEWEREIEKHLSTASIILLLVSADFVDSDYCYGVEMQKALELHEQGKVRVLPILLRPVDWQGAPFAKLQILPTGAIPITEWSNQDTALADVARGIRDVVSSLRSH